MPNKPLKASLYVLFGLYCVGWIALSYDSWHNLHYTHTFMDTLGALSFGALWPLLFFGILFSTGIGWFVSLAFLAFFVLIVKRKFLLAFSLVLSALFLGVTLWATSSLPVHESTDFTNIRWGFPFTYVIQDKSNIDGASVGHILRFGTPMESPTQLLWPQFLAVFALHFLTVFGFLALTKAALYTPKAKLQEEATDTAPDNRQT